MPHVSAVFTGDLIGSRKAPTEAVDRAMNALGNASQALGRRHEFDPRFTRNRGDGWQILLPDPRLVLVAFLSLTAGLRAADAGLATRIGIGLGPVEFAGGTDLSDAAGAAFVTSGELLERLSHPRTGERVLIEGPGSARWQQGILALADRITRRWSAQQAEAVALVLLSDHDTNACRARALGITRQAFEARLRGAGLEAFDAARDAFHQHRFDETP